MTSRRPLDESQKAALKTTVLNVKSRVEEEVKRQLEKYGFHPTKRQEEEDLGHLTLPERARRERLDAAIQREQTEVSGYQSGHDTYVKEAAKRTLYRLVGIIALEQRGLLDTEVLTERAQFGSRSELHYTVTEVAGELAEAKDDGKRPTVQLAYQELAAEVGLVFDKSDYAVLNLDHTVFDDVVGELQLLPIEVWTSDDVLGWVYQYYGEEERTELDRRNKEENYKYKDTDIAVKTQLFTPHRIVEWMVDNSLGRLWWELEPDSELVQSYCSNLNPHPDAVEPRADRSVGDLKVLDPACGGGHMLVYAFDLLYQMYLEEGDVLEQNIPREILRKNLFGVDIDSGAVQLAALSLYCKAKQASPDVDLDRINLVAADAVLVNGTRQRELSSDLETELERQVVDAVFDQFDHLRERGSLVRIEDAVEALMEEQPDALAQLRDATEPGPESRDSATYVIGEEEYGWEALKGRLVSHVRNIGERALTEHNPVAEMFATDVEKSVQLLDVFLADFDVVVTNPPYMSSNRMDPRLKTFLKERYAGSRDLYTAFIERCHDFVTDDGFVAMITMDTFMYQYAYRNFRTDFLLDSTNFVEALHLKNRDEGYMNIAHVTRQLAPEANPTSTKFLRLIDIHDDEEKWSQLRAHQESEFTFETDVAEFVVNQSTFDTIDRSPIVYWFGQDVLDIFDRETQLGASSPVKVGLQTGDDDHFTRKWWEVPPEDVPEKGVPLESPDEPYRWFVKSGDELVYSDPTDLLVDWANDGEAIKTSSDSVVRNEEFIGEPGLTFRLFSKRFTARDHPEGHIFSHTANYVGPWADDPETLAPLLGYLNSSLVQFIADGLNPGLRFQAGDAENIPTKPVGEYPDEIGELAELAVTIQRRRYRLHEQEHEFDPSTFLKSIDRLLLERDLVEADVCLIHNRIDDLVFDVFDLGEDTRDRVTDDERPYLLDRRHIELVGAPNSPVFDRLVVPINHSVQDLADLETAFRERTGGDLLETAEELDISPYTVALFRHESGAYSAEELESVASRIVSYVVGELFGRWDELPSIRPIEDGIAVLDDRPNNGVSDRFRNGVEAVLDGASMDPQALEAWLGAEPFDWIQESFFRYHHAHEYSRRGQEVPIYWHLESDGGAFSCLLYYHRFDRDTLSKLRGQYLDPFLDRLENRRDSIKREIDEEEVDSDTDDGSEASGLRGELDEVQSTLDEVREFGERVDRLIDSGNEPDPDEGIFSNLQPLDDYGLLQTPLDKL